MVFPPGSQEAGAQAFIFWVEVSDVKGLIREIERLPNPRALPSRYQFLGAPETWKERFWVEPFFLPQFLADQIARRTRLDLMS